MADQVVDSNVWVAYWIRRRDQPDQYASTARLIQELRQGQHRCHLPYLVLVEICATILREVPRPRRAMTLISQIKGTFQQWEQMGVITWYELTRQRTELAISLNSGLSLHLKGADNVIAALAEELQIPVKTFETEILQRYPNATT